MLDFQRIDSDMLLFNSFGISKQDWQTVFSTPAELLECWPTSTHGSTFQRILMDHAVNIDTPENIVGPMARTFLYEAYPDYSSQKQVLDGLSNGFLYLDARLCHPAL